MAFHDPPEHQSGGGGGGLVGDVGKGIAGRAASFEPPYPRGRGLGWVGERGSLDRALIKWQREDQSWLRNRATKRRE